MIYTLTVDGLRHVLSGNNYVLDACCESPIEKKLGQAIVLRMPWIMVRDRLPSYNALFMIPQYTVGPYMADFMLCLTIDEGEMYKVYPNGRPYKRHFLALECDGHMFHEKTKDQAAHDKKRDRYFTNIGIPYLRFTGSEIYKDVESCVDEVEQHMERWG